MIITSEIVTALLEGFGSQLQNIIAIASSAYDCKTVVAIIPQNAPCIITYAQCAFVKVEQKNFCSQILLVSL